LKLQRIIWSDERSIDVINKKKLYPFTAIVGQESMKKALILNIINPSLGGVLIRGEKGTAKSTAVRAFAELLPQREEVEECMFSCNPDDISSLCGDCLERYKKGEDFSKRKGNMKVIDLPVSATEDRVVGTLDIEHAIKKGEKRFEPGILAMANRNILYVDEVNLLDDHVVDVLLDSAAMGVNTIEREGISYVHPAKFILIGTMNPEEGDLRPQLLDRFGMVVDVVGEKEIDNRVEVIKRRIEYEEDSHAFALKWEENQIELREKILHAMEILKKIRCHEDMYKTAAMISIELGVDGHRADISMIKTAKTVAAFDGKLEVDKKHMIEAASLVLPHRMRRRPFEEGVVEFSKVEELIRGIKDEK
jgi:magnesium chelatase subunit I